MEESYFIISQDHERGLHSSSTQSSIKEINQKYDFLHNSINNSNNKQLQSLCQTCENELLDHINNKINELNNQLRAYDLLEYTLNQDTNNNNIIETFTTKNNSKQSNQESNEITELNIQYNNSKHTELVYNTQLTTVLHNNYTLSHTIDNEIDILNQLYNTYNNNITDIRVNLELINNTLYEIKMLSTVSMAPVFNLVSTHDIHTVTQQTSVYKRTDIHTSNQRKDAHIPIIQIINGFRLAYSPSIQHHINWKEIQLSLSLICTMLLMYRNKYNYSDVIILQKRDHFRTQTFDDAPYTLLRPKPDFTPPTTSTTAGESNMHNTNTGVGAGVESRNSNSSNQGGDYLSALRIIRILPLRHQTALFVRDVVMPISSINTCITAPVPDCPSSLLGSDARQRHARGGYYDKECMYTMYTDTHDSSAMNTSEADHGGNLSLRTNQAIDYQISIHLIAVLLVCTIYQRQLTHLISPSSTLQPYLHALIVADDSNVPDIHVPRLFKFIETSRVINVDYDDDDDGSDDEVDRERCKPEDSDVAMIGDEYKDLTVTGYPETTVEYTSGGRDGEIGIGGKGEGETIGGVRGGVSERSGRGERDRDRDLDTTVFINRGKSASEMSALVRDIFTTLQALSSL